MAEFRKLPTQAELQNMLFMEQMRVKTPQQIAQEALASGTTVTPIPENVFQKIAGGAGIAKEYVNRAGSAADLAKLFPGYKPETRVNIPTGYNFAPKQAPTGEVIPGGLQTQNVNLGQVLGAIKPADVLGISGAERAYSDIGAGKAPQPLDVLDVAGLGATGLVGGKAALRATKGVPVGMSIQEAKGLLTEAPRSPLGFYSALEESALNLQRNKGSGQAFLNDLQKAPNVKADEIKWTGLDEFLKTKPNVTKQEVQDYLANNRVDVQEVQLGGAQPYNAQRLSQLESEYRTLKQHPIDDPSFGEEKYNELIRLTNIRDQSTTETLYDSAERAMQNAQRAQRQGNNLTAEKYFREAEFFNTRAEKLDLEGQGMSNPPKFGKYTLPGGENYREILLTMPSKKIPIQDFLEKMKNKYGDNFSQDKLSMEDKETFDRLRNESVAPQQYASVHFDQPNILAHLRVNDRVDADGKKMLLIEEVQSDWHQAGRERGYQQKPMTELPSNLEIVVDQYANSQNSKYIVRDKETGLHSGWFGATPEQAKETWLAAQNRKMQNADMVPDAPFKDSWYQLALKRAIQYAAENGYDRIGLTTAERQIKRYPDEKNVKGMKKYYDEIYPKFLDKYGKKWGARVGETTINLQRDLEGFMPRKDMQIEPVRYLDVTPEMKASVSKGQPLFQALPAIPATGLLATQDENR